MRGFEFKLIFPEDATSSEINYYFQEFKRELEQLEDDGVTVVCGVIDE